MVSSSLYAVLPVPCFPLPARRGIRLCVSMSWELHGGAMLPRLRRCWILGVSNHPCRPLAKLVVVRARYESLGGQHLIVAAISGLSPERYCETTRADFTVAWMPHASPLPSSAAWVCLRKGRISCETITLASLRPSWTCHSPSRSRVAILFHNFMSIPTAKYLDDVNILSRWGQGGPITHP
jgi:hypothetical protein